ncbi:MAG: isoprenylcysteine carboxylmethyltransferase family protein [Gammaproteobacteria bacterium]|nr:isoprenylcysteine carboxylmethyltransferase family protein [Gammaproteobacteria bacterium]
MNKQVQNNIKLWLQFAVRMTLFAIALMWPAGSWHWWEAWVLVGLWTAFGLVLTPYLLRHDPALLAERLKLVPLHKDQKSWDKVLMLLFFIAGIGLYLIPGFDVVRYEWSEPFPLWMRITAMLVHIPCFLFLGWVMRENTFLSQVVKIDKARGHKVITTGPYSLVRHPMYTVIIVLLYVVPVALGSRYALIIALFLTILLIVRTYFEDRTLYKELEGYPEYTQQTPYRLIPKVW